MQKNRGPESRLVLESATLSSYEVRGPNYGFLRGSSNLTTKSLEVCGKCLRADGDLEVHEGLSCPMHVW